MREAAGRGTTTGRSRDRRGWAVLAVLGVLASLVAAGVGHEDLVRPGGATLFADFLAAALTPRLDAEFLGLTAQATLVTLGFAALGTAASLAIGIVGGILTSQAWWRGRGIGWGMSRAVLVVPRGIHEVVWGLFLLSVLGLEPVVAVLAIAIPFGAVTAKVYSEILDDADQRPYRALLAAGAPRAVAVAYGLLPGATGELVSYAFYRFECAIRSAAVLGIIGAGGLGFQLALSFQALQYDEIWTLLIALILLCAGTDGWSAAVRRGRAPRVSLAAAALLLPASAWLVSLDVTPLWAGRSWELAGQLLAASWPPRFVPDLVALAAATLAMSVLAIAIAFAGGALLAIPAANLSRLTGQRRRLLAGAVRALLVVLRAIPPPVWALLVLFVVSPGVLAGAIALGIYTVGVLGRLMAESAENLDPRPSRALLASGAAPLAILAYSVVPAAAPRFVAYGLYRWEVTLRETVVVGVVGAGGLGLLLNSQLVTFDQAGAVATLVVLVGLTLAVDLTSSAVRRAVQ